MDLERRIEKIENELDFIFGKLRTHGYDTEMEALENYKLQENIQNYLNSGIRRLRAFIKEKM